MNVLKELIHWQGKERFSKEYGKHYKLSDSEIPHSN